jgi:hypothetical protein
MSLNRLSDAILNTSLDHIIWASRDEPPRTHLTLCKTMEYFYSKKMNCGETLKRKGIYREDF